MNTHLDDHAHTLAARRDLDDDVVAGIRIGRADQLQLSPLAATAAGGSSAVIYLVLSRLVPSTLLSVGALAFVISPWMVARARRVFLPNDAKAKDRSRADDPLLLVIRPDRADIHRMQRFASRVGPFVESHPLSAVELRLGDANPETRVAVGEDTFPVIGRSVANLRSVARRIGLRVGALDHDALPTDSTNDKSDDA